MNRKKGHGMMSIEEVTKSVQFQWFWEDYMIAMAFTATSDAEEIPFGLPGMDIRDCVTHEEITNVINQTGEYESLRTDCVNFLATAQQWIDMNNESSVHDAGSDFHLTRNGCGSGFWGRNIPHRDELTELAETASAAELYLDSEDGPCIIS